MPIIKVLQPFNAQPRKIDFLGFSRLISRLSQNKCFITIQMNDLEVADTAFEKYARYGMSLLKDLTGYFQEAEPQARRKLLGSIFPAKLVFQDGNYRTSALNPALALILQKNKRLGNEKAEDIVISDNASGDVERSGLEPLTSTMPLWRSTI